jgi:hypothetical protein
MVIEAENKGIDNMPKLNTISFADVLMRFTGIVFGGKILVKK